MELLQAVWSECLRHLASTGAARRTALAALVQFSALLKDPALASAASLGSRGPEFWALLRTCLAGEDPLDRKRAAHVMQQLVPAQRMKQPGWTAWLMVHR